MTHEGQLDLFAQEDPKVPKPISAADFQLLTIPARHDYSEDAGGEYPLVHPPQEITVGPGGPSLELRGRAQALIDIMEYYDYNNRDRARNARGIGSPELRENAEKKHALYNRRFREALGYLYPKQDLIEAGFVSDSPDSTHEVAFQSDMNKTFGLTGQEYQKRRDKMIKGLFKQAETMGFRLSAEPKNRPKPRSPRKK